MPRALPGWLAAVAARLARRPVRRPARRPLAAEPLEAREVPATYSWTPTGPGAYSWTDPANWTGGPVGTYPDAVGDVAVLSGTLTGNQLINLNDAITLGALNIGSSGTAGGYTVAANGTGNGLTFDSDLGTAVLNGIGDGTGDAVLAPITLIDNLTITGGGTDTLALAGGVNAPAARTLTVAGTVTLLDDATVGPNVTLAGTGTLAAVPVTYSTSFYDGALYAFHADTGAQLATLVAPNAGAASLVLPAGLTVGPDGNLYVSNQGFGFGSNSIARYNLDTFAVETFITAGQLAAVPLTNGGDAEFSPAGLQFGPDGDLYVSQNGGFGGANPDAVVRFDVTNTAGVLSYGGTFTTVAGAQNQPNGLTFGTAAGDETTLYVGTAAGVVRIANATTVPGAAVPFILPGPGSGGLEFAAGLAFGSDGDLFVADLGAFTGAGKVLRFNPDGTFDSEVVAAGSGANPGDLFGQFPSDLYFDPQGRLVVVNLGPAGGSVPSNDYAGSLYRYTVPASSNPGAFDTALVTAAQFPDTQDTPAVGDDEATGIVPSQAERVGAATLTVLGRLSPAGDGAVGTLTVPSLTLSPTSIYTFELGAGGNDRITSTGTVALNDAVASFGAIGGFAAPLGNVYTIVSAAAVTGTLGALADGAVFSDAGVEYRINYTATTVTLTRVQSPEITSGGAATFYTGRANTFTVTSTGTPTITYTLGGDPLPPELTFNTTTGELSGTPTVATTYNLTVTATSSAPGLTPDTEPLVLTVLAGAAPDITTANNAAVVQGTGGTFDVNATATPDATFALTGAPAGVTIDPTTGLITVGTTVPNGVYTFDVTAANGVAPDDVQPFTLTVGTVPEVTSPGTATFYTNRDNTFTVTATGFPTPVLSSDPLPAGLMFDAGTGILSGTPTVAPGDYTITFTATNAVGSDAEVLTLTVAAGVAPLITTANNAAVVQGTTGTFDVNATGTPAPTFSLTGAPAGVTIDPTTGLITVTPAVANGVYPFTVTADNDVAPDAVQSFTLTVGTVPEVTSGGSVTFISGVPASFPLTATGSPAPTITVTGALPAGVTFNSTTNTIEGTPTATGPFTVTVTATNAVGSDGEPLTITVQAGAAPACTTPNTLLVGTATGGTLDVNATGNPAPTFSLTGAPAGVTIDPTTGLLTVPAGLAVNTYTFDITATNPLGGATQTFTLTVGSPPAFTNATSTVFPAGQAGSFVFTATGSPAPTFAFTGGTLPPGITLSPSGTLSGTATQVGTFPITVTASNGVSPNATQQFTLTIGQGPVITSANVAAVGSAGGTFQVTATGTPAPTFAVSAQPAGVTINPTTGLLTVAAGVTPGVYNLTVTATNAVGGANQVLNLTVTSAPVAVPPDLPSRLAVGGQTNGGAALFDPNAAGTYATTPTATVNPFAGLGVLVRSAVGDVNGDGIDDTIVVTGPGTPVRFAVVSGVDNRTLLVGPTAAFAGSEDFAGGAFVSTGDLDGDGRDDIVLSPDQGGGARVVVMAFRGGTLQVVANFLGIDDPGFRGGARTAVGDVNGDGRPDLAVAAGFLGGPRVALFDGKTVIPVTVILGITERLVTNPLTRLVNDFFAFPGADAETLRNGAYVTIGDITGDGFGELIFGGGPGGAPRVFILSGAVVSTGNVSGAQAAPVANFFVANNSADRGGARVGVVDANGDGRADLAVGSGPGQPARVRVYLAQNVTANGEPAPFQDLFPFTGEVLTDGVYVS